MMTSDAEILHNQAAFLRRLDELDVPTLAVADFLDGLAIDIEDKHIETVRPLEFAISQLKQLQAITNMAIEALKAES